MTSGLEFGIQQGIVDGNLEPASIGRDEGDTCDLRLEVVQKVICQAYSPVGEVSNCTVNDRDLYQRTTPWVIFQKLYCFLVKSVHIQIFIWKTIVRLMHRIPTL